MNDIDDAVKRVCAEYNKNSECRLLGLTLIGNKYLQASIRPRWWNGYPGNIVCGDIPIYDIKSGERVYGGSLAPFDLSQVMTDKEYGDRKNINILPFLSEEDKTFIMDFEKEVELFKKIDCDELFYEMLELGEKLSDRGMNRYEKQKYISREYRYEHIYPKYIERLSAKDIK